MQFEFTMKYAFFVQMGGLKAPIKDIFSLNYDRHEYQIIPDDDRGAERIENATLTTHGVLSLARLGCFIPIPSSKIDDKSKSSLIQKCLVSIQLSWMVIQCVVRAAYGLPVTLLEVHTMVHALCALAIYGFWIRVCRLFRTVFQNHCNLTYFE